MPDLLRRSPLNWIGGKFFSAGRIVAAFPPPSDYDVYAEPFGGAAHVFYEKPKYGHMEIYSDKNGDLVNFWMIARDHAEELQAAVGSLPYSRELFYEYWTRLREKDYQDNMERAVLWFYVQRSGIAGTGTTRESCPGWGYAKRGRRPMTSSYHNSNKLLSFVRERFWDVQIDNRDFESIINTFGMNKRSLVYCDPPYYDAEVYYKGAVGMFTHEDHERLSVLLNQNTGYVALSYYDHPVINELYPEPKWRRMRWTCYKHSEKLEAGAKRQISNELLIMNYQPNTGIWTPTQSSADTSCYALEEY